MIQSPKRDRWAAWVSLAWLLAVVSVVGGIAMIASMGTVEMPVRNALGNIRWSEEPNYIVWGAAIGQALAALLLAAIFSILNSIYQNSCDIFAHHAGIKDLSEAYRQAVASPDEPDLSETEVDNTDYGVPGLTVVSVHDASPLRDFVRPQFALLAVNGKGVTSELEAARSLVEGKNSFTLRDDHWTQFKCEVEMKPGPLHIRFS